ncbi:MAG: ATP-dependent Clp protease proteolytic subunit [Candidatus Eremiobacteraeota bacterium]|nr:ATP-dependent Clp protease proteolytic subunit [Candidatus Eremiobacteraeota bacterium]
MVGLLRLRMFFVAALVLGAVLGTTGFIFNGQPVSASTAQRVVTIPIDGTVDDGMAHLVRRAVTQADAEHADAIVLVINSGGGLLQAGMDIRDAVLGAHEPTIAFVSQRAYSAAALIALSAQKIIMAPGASIGDAQPIPDTHKLETAVAAEFESTALRNHRDPKIAAAMVDEHIELPEYKKAGLPLTLNTRDALRAKIADSMAPTLADALRASHLSDATLTTAAYSFGEQLARFATSPAVSGLLLTLGLLGLLIEMQTLHGIAGFIGLSALALFFGSHVYAGFSNGFVIALAIVGLMGILFELHVVPGHGLPGVAGGIALFFAVMLAFGISFFFVALQTVATALVSTVLLFWLATRAFPENAFMKKITLLSDQGPDYVTSSDFSDLRGAIGTATSYLRPAGVALLRERRVDVLTQGDFIPAGTPIRVTRVEGARIFVEPVTLPSYKE